uniref:SBF1/SBF2 domain-containing protein n=1 Tax=Eptatretus burgeri TaxID=7764 RepID=A0A8C4QZY3_EPTBU
MELIENIFHSKFSTSNVPTEQDVTSIREPKSRVNGTSVSYKVLVTGSENRLENETVSRLCPTDSAAHFHLEQTRISHFRPSKADSKPAEFKSSHDLEENPSNLFSKLYAFPNCVNSMGIETRRLDDASGDSPEDALESTSGAVSEDPPSGEPEDPPGGLPTQPLDRPASLPMDNAGNGGMNWDETAKFMHAYIEQIFSPGTDVSSDDKSRFGKLCQEMHSTGRLWFSRFLCEQRCNSKLVSEQTFFRLVQSIAVVLFECHNLDDFGPAKNLMTMCFTYYYMSHATTEPSFFKKNATKGQNKTPARWRDVFDFRELRHLVLGDDKSGLKAESKQDGDDDGLGTEVNAERQKVKAYLYSHLKQQPIWHTSRFWDAAFLDAVHSERNKQSPTTHQKWYLMTPEERDDENRTNENLTFGQLSTFIFNMLCLGLGRSECETFLDKHCIIGNLSEVQKETLQKQMEDVIIELDL